MFFVPVLKPPISRPRINTVGLETKATIPQVAPPWWKLPSPDTKHSFQIRSLLLGVKHKIIALESWGLLVIWSVYGHYLEFHTAVEGNKEHWTVCILISLSVNHKFGWITWRCEVSFYKQEWCMFIISRNEASCNVFSSRSLSLEYLRREFRPVSNTANARQANPRDVMSYCHTHATELTKLERDWKTGSKDTNKEDVHSPKD